MKISEAFIISIDKNYSRQSLETFYKNILIHFLLENESFIKNHGLKLDILIKKKLVKEDFLILFSYILYNREIFDKLLSYLPKTINKILHFLLFEGTKEYKELVEKFPDFKGHCKIVGENLIIEPECLILPHKKEDYHAYAWSNRSPNLYFHIPYEIRTHWLTLIPIPEEYKLKPIKGPSANELILNAEATIISDLPLFISTYLQGDIKYNNHFKAQAGSLNKLRKAGNIQEFFDTDDKELNNIRTIFLAEFLPLIEKKDPPMPEEVPDILIKGLTKMINTHHISPLYHWLRYIKGSVHVKNGYEDHTVIFMMLKMLQNIPTGEWFAYKNIEKYINLNFPKLEPVTQYAATNHLYLDATGGSNYYDRLYISVDHYDLVIRKPLIKGFCFFLASLGLLEISYDYPPDEPKGINQVNRDFISPYDGLSGIRITDLGAYVMGLKKEYTVPEQIQNYTLDIHEEHLLISFSGDNKIIEMFLDKIAVKSGEKRYKVDYASFLKDCKLKDDIHNKIVQFKKIIKSDLPPLWLDFFDDILTRYNPIHKVSAYQIFKIPPQHKALASLIARDEVLKNILIKAEDYHFFIKEKDKSILKSRLSSLGYLMP